MLCGREMASFESHLDSYTNLWRKLYRMFFLITSSPIFVFYVESFPLTLDASGGKQINLYDCIFKMELEI